jgi:hypothetical protein
VWRRAAWAALFFYVLFAFGCSAMSDSAIGIKDEADGCCVTLPKCVEVQKFAIANSLALNTSNSALVMIWDVTVKKPPDPETISSILIGSGLRRELLRMNGA